jgi:hypothetical protein
LLAAEPPTSAETKLIRFLTESRLPEAKALLQKLGGIQLSIGIVEELILPTLKAIENDLYPGAGSPTKSRIYAQLRELIEEMTVEIPAEPDQPPEQSTSGQPGIVIMPFTLLIFLLGRSLAFSRFLGYDEHVQSEWAAFTPRLCTNVNTWNSPRRQAMLKPRDQC